MNDKPKRRWYQFSLLRLFVVITLLAMALGVSLLCIAPAVRQRASAKKVSDLRLREGFGGWLPRDYSGKVTDVYLSGTNATDTDLPHLHGFPHLETLSLQETQVTDAGLVHLQVFSKLIALRLDGTRVNGSGLVHLHGLRQLYSLSLDNTQVTDDELANIEEMTQLGQIGLSGTPVTDAGLTHLYGLSRLEYLDVAGTKVTNEGVEKMQKALPNCEIKR